MTLDQLTHDEYEYREGERYEKITSLLENLEEVHKSQTDVGEWYYRERVIYKDGDDYYELVTQRSTDGYASAEDLDYLFSKVYPVKRIVTKYR